MTSSAGLVPETAVAWWGPLPPQRSGIADSSVALLARLSFELELVAVVDDQVKDLVDVPEGIRVMKESDASETHFALDVYQFGNNWAYHGFMFRRALGRAGLLVLHDPSLYDFYVALAGGPASPVLAEEISYDSFGRLDLGSLPHVATGGGRLDVDRPQVLLCRRLVEASRMVLVQSSWVASVLEQRYGVPARAVDHFKATIGSQWTAGRRADRACVPLVFGVFGGLSRNKRVIEVVEVFSELVDAGLDLRLVIAGHPDDADVVGQVQRLIDSTPASRRRISIELSPALDRLHELVAGCDVVVSLRWPTTGEVSGTLATATGFGKPAIVSDLPQLREVPEGMWWRVSTEPGGEREQLRETVRLISNDPASLKNATAVATRYAATLSPDQVVCQYRAAVEACLARPMEVAR